MDIFLYLFGVLGLFLFLFFVAGLILNNNKKVPAKPTVAKIESSAAGKTESADSKTYAQNSSGKKEEPEYNAQMIQELNTNNLADEIETLIETDTANTAEKAPERIFRSRLSNTGRMRHYYEHKHRCRSMNKLDDLDSDYQADDRHDDEEIKLSQDDIKKLVALQKLFDEKDGKK